MENDKLLNKTIIAVIIFLTVILVVLLLRIYSDVIKVGQRELSKSSKKTVTIWTIHGGIETILNEVVRDYAKEHQDINFEITSFKNEVYQSTIENAIITNELPDIFFTWGYGVLEGYVDLGLVWDITSTVDQYDLRNKALPHAIDGFTFNERIYGLPLYGWNVSLFCNKELFKKHNIDYPTNYQEFISTVQQFKEKGVTPVAGSSKEMWLPSLYYMSLVLEEGEIQGVYDAAADPAKFNTIQFYKAAEKMQELIDSDPWQESYSVNDAYDATYLFIEEKTAMLLSGSWVASAIESQESKVRGKVDVISFPNNKILAGVGGYADTFVVSKKSAIAQDAELQKLYIDMMRDVSRRSIEEIPIGLPAYKDQFIDAQKFPVIYQSSQINPIKGQHPAYDQIFDSETAKKYYDALQSLVYKEIDARQFINYLSQ